jgi:thiol-disulfide isomerase/thioredoxin
VDTIAAPPFPRDHDWVNVASLRMDKQLGRPVLIEFWDFCRPYSLRTLPYLKEWHRRYARDGLRVIGVHASGFPPSASEGAVESAVQRLGIEYPVVIDANFAIWQDYGNQGWPARYLWDPAGNLFEFHFGEGGYAETELAIQELLGVEREPMEPVRPEDTPGAELAAPTPDQDGAYSGPYEAGAVWAVLEGSGEVRANGERITVEHPGAYVLVEHPRHTEGVLELEVGGGVRCHATCFTPGLAGGSTLTG